MSCSYGGKGKGVTIISITVGVELGMRDGAMYRLYNKAT